MSTIFGKDLNRVNKRLNDIKDETSKQIHLLARESDHRMETITHSHNVYAINGNHGDGIGIPQHHVHAVPGIDNPTGAQGSDGYVSRMLTYPDEYLQDRHKHHLHIEPYIIYEREHCVSAHAYTDPIYNLWKEFWEDDGKKMKHIDEERYVEKERFNDLYGSPWQEIYILKEKMEEMNKYADDYPTLQWLGEKHSLLTLMQVVLSYTIDAKIACIFRHDFVQRGYDQEFNGLKPSVTWDDFDDRTIGNVNQYIPNKVNINGQLGLDDLKRFFGNIDINKIKKEIKGLLDPF